MPASLGARSLGVCAANEQLMQYSVHVLIAPNIHLQSVTLHTNLGDLKLELACEQVGGFWCGMLLHAQHMQVYIYQWELWCIAWMDTSCDAMNVGGVQLTLQPPLHCHAPP